MISVYRASERHLDRYQKQEVLRTFDPRDRAGLLADGGGALGILNESRLAPGARVPRLPLHDADIVTYVREGTLAYGNSMGRSGVIRAGEFQRITTGRGIRPSETNASRTDWAHIFQVWLRLSDAGSAPSHEQKRFSAAERRGHLCTVASPDGRRGSLRIHQDALIYAAMLDAGKHVVHELSEGRGAWLHIVEGEVAFGNLALSAGDGAHITAERAVSITAREETEILLLDLGGRHPKYRNNGSAA